MHQQPLFLQQLLCGMSCLTSPIPSLAWARLPTKTSQLSLSQTTVTVYHPDGHPILSGWRDETGLHLWCFPLTTKAANPQDATGATAPWVPIPSPSPLPAPPPSVMQLLPPSPVVILPTVSATTNPSSQPGHPCHRHVLVSLLGLLSVRCSPGCCLGCP